MTYETYEMICDLLMNEDLDVADIALMVGVTLEEVQYVDRAENDIM